MFPIYKDTYYIFVVIFNTLHITMFYPYCKMLCMYKLIENNLQHTYKDSIYATEMHNIRHLNLVCMYYMHTYIAIAPHTKRVYTTTLTLIIVKYTLKYIQCACTFCTRILHFIWMPVAPYTTDCMWCGQMEEILLFILLKALLTLSQDIYVHRIWGKNSSVYT